MDEHLAAFKAPSLRSVARLLVLVGAAVVGWLMVSGGPAQADDNGPQGADVAAAQPAADEAVSDPAAAPATPPAADPGASSTPAVPADPGAQSDQSAGPAEASSKPVLQVPGGLVQGAAALVSDPVRAVPHEASQVVDQVTAPAPPAVRTVAQSVAATVEPTLTAATSGVADSLDRTASVADAVVDPVLQTTGLQAAPRDASPATSGAAATPVASQRDQARSHDRRTPVVETSVGRSAIVLASDHFTRHADAKADTEPESVPPRPDTPSAPSTVTVGAAAGLLVGLLLLAPAFLRRLGLVDSEPLPAGPAFPPGSSPD